MVVARRTLDEPRGKFMRWVWVYCLVDIVYPANMLVVYYTYPTGLIKPPIEIYRALHEMEILLKK